MEMYFGGGLHFGLGCLQGEEDCSNSTAYFFYLTAYFKILQLHIFNKITQGLCISFLV